MPTTVFSLLAVAALYGLGEGSTLGRIRVQPDSHHRLLNVSVPEESSTVVIGNFDGVHRGHQALVQEAKRLDPDGYVVVVTFWPHPLTVVAPDQAPALLCSLERRIEWLKDAGASEVRVVNFTTEIASWAPAAFVERVLGPLQPRHVLVGQNFRFGRQAVGTPDALAEHGCFQVHAMDLVAISGVTVSSTRVREVVAAGKVTEAAELLGRPFEVGGVVVMGDQRGRELGFPTANLVVPQDRAVPADGVYAGWLEPTSGPDAGRRLPSAISVGTNPTFDGVERRVETYVIDRDDLELYGVDITVTFAERLRGQIKFDGIEPLISQMADDVETAKRVLS
ncbi:riboflavin biosynthesis protein RibF [Cutibacterium acnes HL053PA2]|uniref:bifunctional riboflavin kinase/FAD synthetase n=1 Tax=Cutibacterium acnes TaxID=1747 RepID=UPI0001F0A6CC|nr:bifunctional riboflavin kinase/FAD synthetase [Cutibacterium acnes]EFT51485.1 riboflavin biosynthesis protein RibF [Cutibacterium acnes HL053PA2]